MIIGYYNSKKAFQIMSFMWIFKKFIKILIYKIELNILNSLIGSNDIENDFEKIILKYPEVLKCIPLLLAVRAKEIYAIDDDGEFIYSFNKMKHSIHQYKIFMQKTGLFDLISKHLISNLVDYATGIETGLDSNARKNRGGHLMEDFIESCLKKHNIEYYKEMNIKKIESKWNVDLSKISHNGKTQKRFDFVVKKRNMIYGIEANFYSTSGSKLNETARSYENIALNSNGIENFTFVWFTDGIGWKNARYNLQQTFDKMEHIYNINDIKNGIIEKLFVE